MGPWRNHPLWISHVDVFIFVEPLASHSGLSRMYPSLRVPTFCLLLSSVLVLTGTVVGCTSSRSASHTDVQADEAWTPEQVKARIRAAAAEWSGTPHEWGGSSLDGVDCSGLVQSVYKSQFNVSVPRTTEDQATTGQTVSRSTLQPGDLVFFRITKTSKNRHVGIYISENEFLHASSSSGVRVSSLDTSYWTDRWWKARRVLNTDHRASSTSSDTLAGSSGQTNVGW